MAHAAGMCNNPWGRLTLTEIRAHHLHQNICFSSSAAVACFDHATKADRTAAEGGNKVHPDLGRKMTFEVMLCLLCIFKCQMKPTFHASNAVISLYLTVTYV